MDRIKITFLGQTGFAVDYQGTRLVTDPYLSDYVDRCFYTDQTPWRRLYPPPTTLAELGPQGILVSHSHGDHLDPWTLTPYYAAGGSAVLALPAPEISHAEGLGAPRVLAAEAEQPFVIGDIRITPVACAHTQLHTDEQGRFRELSYILSCGGIKVFFGGDLSLYDGLTQRLAQERCDVLLLPVNGGDYYRTQADIIGNISCTEAAELTARTGARFFVPMHHDLYAINGCRVRWVLDAAQDAGVQAQPLAPGQSLTVEEADHD